MSITLSSKMPPGILPASRPASHSISASAGRGPVARGLSATLAPPRPNAGPTDRPTHRMGKPAALMWMVSTRPQASSWLRTCGEGRWRGQQGPEAPDATPSVARWQGAAGSREADTLWGSEQSRDLERLSLLEGVPVAPDPFM